MKELTPSQAKELLDTDNNVQVLDVREKWEHDICKIEQAKLISLGKLSNNVDNLDKEKSILCYCHHGIRSLQACVYLESLGFECFNLKGGVDRWSVEIDSKVARY